MSSLVGHLNICVPTTMEANMFAGQIWSGEAVKYYREMVDARYLQGSFWGDVYYAITGIIEAGIDTACLPGAEIWDSTSLSMAWGFLIVRAARNGDRPTTLEGNRQKAYDYALSLLGSDRNDTKPY